MAINMKKGDSPLSLRKSDVIKLRCTWPADTDYDLYAMVVYNDGREPEYVATFPAGKKGVFGSTFEYPARQSNSDGSVHHLGDVRRGVGDAEEIIEVRLNPAIKAVVAVAYSAQSNGTGSFRDYKVTTEISAGDQNVAVHAGNASDDRGVYTLVPGMIVNEGDSFTVHALELYSKRGSELRPWVEVVNGDAIPVMDRGPKNAYK